jgi:hypothetical protein
MCGKPNLATEIEPAINFNNPVKFLYRSFHLTFPYSLCNKSLMQVPQLEQRTKPLGTQSNRIQWKRVDTCFQHSARTAQGPGVRHTSNRQKNDGAAKLMLMI